MSTRRKPAKREGKNTLYFYYPKNVDYMNYIDSFNNHI